MHNFSVSDCSNILLISSDQLPASKGSFRIKEVSRSSKQIYDLYSEEKNNRKLCLHNAPFNIDELSNTVNSNDFAGSTLIYITGVLLDKNGELHLPVYKPKQTGFAESINLKSLLQDIESKTSNICVVLDTIYFSEAIQLCGVTEAQLRINELLKDFSDIKFIVNSPENTTSTYIYQNNNTVLSSSLAEVLTKYIESEEELNCKQWIDESLAFLSQLEEYKLPLVQLSENEKSQKKQKEAVMNDVIPIKEIAETSIFNFSEIENHFSINHDYTEQESASKNHFNKYNEDYQYLLNNVIEEEKGKLEDAFWLKIKDSNIPSAYKLYLDFFDTGKYKKQAEELFKQNIKLKEQDLLKDEKQKLEEAILDFMTEKDEDQKQRDAFAEKVGKTYRLLEDQKSEMLFELQQQRKAIELEKTDLEDLKKDLLDFQKQLKEKDIQLNSLENKLSSKLPTENNQTGNDGEVSMIEALQEKLSLLQLEFEQLKLENKETISENEREKELLITSYEFEKQNHLEQIDQLENTISLLNIIQEQLAERMVKHEKTLHAEKFIQGEKDNCINQLRSENLNLKEMLLQANERCFNLEEKNSEHLGKHKELLAEVVFLKAQLNSIQSTPVEKPVKTEITSEDQIWAKTRATGTTEAFRNYIKSNPDGIYVNEAEMHMATLQMINQTMKKASVQKDFDE
ncbi:hypothetical protein [Chondrinema litorale]|uniref:hypothetical protein n=1 Tax=Chondrinema litorale TaxID=2994555 RepID=UPI002542A576|nr:hypothetical protein [Chondrinema litorale]UZR95791.1 hypothetical protein OQ292_08190 [Chondrinema litorale]